MALNLLLTATEVNRDGSCSRKGNHLQQYLTKFLFNSNIIG